MDKTENQKRNCLSDVMRCDFECSCPFNNGSLKYIALFNKNVISEEEVSRLLDEGRFVWEHDNRIVVMTPEQFDNLFGGGIK